MGGLWLLGYALMAQTVTINSLTPAGPYCAGSTITISYSASGGPATVNNIQFQLLNSGGTSVINKTASAITDDGTNQSYGFVITSTIGTGTYSIKAPLSKFVNAVLATTTSQVLSPSMNSLPQQELLIIHHKPSVAEVVSISIPLRMLLAQAAAQATNGRPVPPLLPQGLAI